MIDLTTWRMAWALLAPSEKREALFALGAIIIGALSAAIMVGAIMPFLAVLADSDRIYEIQILNWAYATFGFTSEYRFLIALGFVSFGVIVISSALQIVRNWIVVSFSMKKMHSISSRLLEKYLCQPYEFFLNRHTGEMSPKVLAEVDQAVTRFLRPAAEFIASSLTVLCVVILLLLVDPLIAVIAFGVLGGIYASISLFTRRHLKRLGLLRVETNGQRFRMANEALTGIKDIKLLGREMNYLERFFVPSSRMANAQFKISLISSIPPLAVQAVALGGVILLCIVLMDSDGLSSGAALGGILPLLGVFAFAGQRLLPELSKIYAYHAEMQAGAPAVRAIYNDLVVDDRHEALPLDVPIALGLKSELQLDQVSYRYPKAEKPGIDNISLQIVAGEKIGIVGSTGAGKTTLADIILGLLPPGTGRLILDGVTISDDNIRAWMKTVGYVPQDIFLADASIADNIALGLSPEQIDLGRVKDAAKIAKIDEFITQELPEGYQTHIGERGVRLSGGQRQRLGIARAMYHDADLIVFDEATSALDNLTEAEVMQAIDMLPGDKTVIMIAHRLSTVKRCDRIVVLDRGKMVGCDSWKALMEGNEAFRRIARFGEAQ